MAALSNDGELMEALYWVCVGATAGLFVAGFEYESRRRREVDRLTKKLHAANRWAEQLTRDLYRERHTSRGEIEKLHNELHLLKHERVTRWKGGK